jgi:hypothetical protein
MFKFVSLLWNNIKKIVEIYFKRENKPYKTLFTEELPDHMENHTIYILGEGEFNWAAGMLCPCGCGDILQMSLHHEGRPRWKITIHANGTVSLSPSINRMVGCKSHFFFKAGYVKWCN